MIICHRKEMVANGDTAHEGALKAMTARWKNPIKGMGWFRQAKRDFAAPPKADVSDEATCYDSGITPSCCIMPSWS